MNRYAFAVVILVSVFYYSCVKPDVSTRPIPVSPEKSSLVIISGYKSSDGYVSMGYVGKTGYFDNDTIDVFVNASIAVKKARLGVYTAGGVLVDYIYCDSIIPQAITTSKPYEEGYGYKYKIRYKPSTKFISGIYRIAKKIPVLIKNSTPTNQILVVYPSNTENAYNINGGASTYTKPAAYAASFLRPTPIHKFANEFIKWNDTSYPFDYISDIDLEDYSMIRNYKLIILIGHNEYWTRQARLNFDSFVAEGKHALVLSGNTMWWQVRYSSDSTQMICYKAMTDPISDPLLKTINWTTMSLQYPVISSIGVDFTKGGYGLKVDSGWNGYKILAPNSPLLKQTGLNKYDILSCPSQEFDGTYLLDIPGQDPVIDSVKLKAYRAELIGYDRGLRNSKTPTLHSFIVYQRTATSGIVINAASTNWCHTLGFAGLNGATLKLVTRNAIELLMTDQPVFSSNEEVGEN